MKKLLLLFIAAGMYSCQPEELEPVNDIAPVPPPVPCTLKLTRDFNPLAVSQFTSFEYTDINGNERMDINPPAWTVDSVDFSKRVRVNAYAGNNLDPMAICNWNLKKDGLVIEVQTVANFYYEN